ncbi:hypothetical protein EXS70_03050 [Candidatus Peribacteria bacterium]|nr:hypothetical protein [Candidatus Peribacteria bacterium]
MQSRFVRSLLSLELEERILNAGALVAVASVFLPWISGEWLGGEMKTYSGLGFYTSFLGLAVFLLNLFILLLTLVPLAGGPMIIRKRYREIIRLLISAQSSVLVLAILTVLTKFTFDFSRMEVRFGIYFCLVGTLVTLFESVLRFLEQRRNSGQELFHHPEDHEPVDHKETLIAPPPPPPPPPAPAAEDHPLYP